MDGYIYIYLVSPDFTRCYSLILDIHFKQGSQVLSEAENIFISLL